MVGYSGRPLVAKLGLRSGDRVALVQAPDNFLAMLQPLPTDIAISTQLRGTKDFLHFFTKSHSELRRRFPTLQRALDPYGMLWISWPKKSSGVTCDVDEGQVRAIGLEHGLVDVKICAVDEVWSGLKFVVRKKDRPPPR